MRNGKNSSLIEFQQSNIAQDSISHLATCCYYHDKHTIWNLLYGHCTFINNNSNASFCTIDVASSYRIHLVVVVTSSSSKYLSWKKQGLPKMGTPLGKWGPLLTDILQHCMRASALTSIIRTQQLSEGIREIRNNP